jgi:putative hemolysin
LQPVRRIHSRLRDEENAMQITRGSLIQESFEIVSGSYRVKIAESRAEMESALRLRHEVFNLELKGEARSNHSSALEFDAFDERCSHLIVVENVSGRTVGTYRLNTFETAGSVAGFYSNSEFDLSTLPEELLCGAVEIGRACIKREHRSSRVLFLLWRGLARFMQLNRKRWTFGCCSIFSTDREAACAAYAYLGANGHIDEMLRVTPTGERIECASVQHSDVPVELPPLFEMYLDLGARVCGEPIVDRAFGTIDFFVILDLESLDERRKRMFLR